MLITSIIPGLEAEVEGLGYVYLTEAYFDQALESLRDFGIENPISARDLAYARTKNPESSLRYGSYTKEGFLYLRNEPVLLALDSPLLDISLARQAVKANRKGDYFSTDKGVYNKYREKAEEDKNKSPNGRRVIILPGKKDYEIPTNRFNEDELTLFLFKDQAENYGNFLKENGIDEMPVWLVDRNYVDSKEKAILTQLWLHPLDSRSDVSGDRGLDYGNRVHGLLKKTDEVSRSQELSSKTKGKIELPYTQKQVEQMYKIISEVREGRLGTSKLEEVINFLDKLKN